MGIPYKEVRKTHRRYDKQLSPKIGGRRRRETGMASRMLECPLEAWQGPGWSFSDSVRLYGMDLAVKGRKTWVQLRWLEAVGDYGKNWIGKRYPRCCLWVAGGKPAQQQLKVHKEKCCTAWKIHEAGAAGLSR